jgi:type II secretory pathway pseudopilin PulG
MQPSIYDYAATTIILSLIIVFLVITIAKTKRELKREKQRALETVSAYRDATLEAIAAQIKFEGKSSKLSTLVRRMQFTGRRKPRVIRIFRMYR